MTSAPRAPDPRKPAPPPPPGISRRHWITFLVILAANFLLMRLLLPNPNAPIALPYTAFKQQVEKRNVEAIYSKGESIEGRFAAPVTWPPPGEKPPAPDARPAAPRTGKDFTTTVPAFVDPGLEAFLISHGVEISAVPIQEQSAWSTLVFGFGPAILIIAFYVWMFRRASRGAGSGGGVMGLGRSQAHRYDVDQERR